MGITTTDRNAIRKSVRKSRQTNPIVYGYFPRKTYKEMAIARINQRLCWVLGIFILFSLISYYSVTSSEVYLNKLGRETTKLNNENVELQNKLDNLYSFNHVDQLVRSKNMLNTAKQVIEVPAANNGAAAAAVAKVPVDENAYKWSIGY
ncbi:MAG: hypothetical protein PHV37_00880 [Candidatus Gastranaerophilales bacterium]|nr:hypothetical protein [Candidatus Gastranaerophilales bacterium]